MKIRPVTEEEVPELSTWRNDPPYDVYDIGDESVEGNIEYLLGPETQLQPLISGAI